MEEPGSDSEVSIDELIGNRRLFEGFVYTSRDEAVRALEKRWSDKEVEQKVYKLLGDDVPPPLKNGFRAVLLRYITTPNYETLRFLHVSELMSNLAILLCEYTDDKFVPSNTLKRMLGKISFFNGKDKMNRIEIINFTKAQNKKISEVTTLWGQSLVEFHHELFWKLSRSIQKNQVYDISLWYRSHGGRAKKYYASVLALFVRHGVLFENFMLEDKEERCFIKNVFLPAFICVMKQTGQKPVVVALEPTTQENDKFWLSYPPAVSPIIEHRTRGFFRKIWLKFRYGTKHLHFGTWK